MKYIPSFLLGAAIAALTFWCLFIFKLNGTAYENGRRTGHTYGRQEGWALGHKEGFASGIAFVQDQQIRSTDSLARIVAQKKADQLRKARAQRELESRVVQNWHVVDGKIAEPIDD